MAADEWHDELVLVAELSSVNNQIARFVLRMLDTDARRREQMEVADECRLGGRLVNLGYALQDRAVHRAAGRPVMAQTSRKHPAAEVTRAVNCGRIADN